jgi:hypothetical protein
MHPAHRFEEPMQADPRRTNVIGPTSSRSGPRSRPTRADATWATASESLPRPCTPSLHLAGRRARQSSAADGTGTVCQQARLTQSATRVSAPPTVWQAEWRTARICGSAPHHAHARGLSERRRLAGSAVEDARSSARSRTRRAGAAGQHRQNVSPTALDDQSGACYLWRWTAPGDPLRLPGGGLLVGIQQTPSSSASMVRRCAKNLANPKDTRHWRTFHDGARTLIALRP